jgi:hypothetical protein
MKRGINHIILRCIFICIFLNCIIISISQVSASSNSSKGDKLSGITLTLDWNDDDIVNGQEFNIDVGASGLLEKDYDVKVFISDTKLLSQTYNGEKWITSNDYIKNLFSGPGNKDGIVKLRIRNDCKDFSGEAQIGLRIRESGSSSYKEIKKDITIRRTQDETGGNDNNDNKGDSVVVSSVVKKTTVNNPIDEKRLNSILGAENSKENPGSLSEDSENLRDAGEVITLGKISSKTENVSAESNVIYQSSNENIKKYAVIGFLVLILILIMLLSFKWI